MHKSSRTRIIPFALLLAYPLFAAAAEDPVADIDGLAQQWIGLERQNDSLRSNWRSQQSVLEQQLSLLEREREQLASTLAETEQQQDAVEERRLALLEQQTQLEQEQEVVDRTLKAAVIDIQGIHPQLPPPLKASWDALLPRLLNIELSTSERLQVLVKMLTTLDDFQRKVTLHQTVMTLADGGDYQLTQVYLGLAAGWYVSDDGRFAGVGRAMPDGWRWETLTDTAAIADIVAILDRRQSPALVTVPVLLESAP